MTRKRKTALIRTVQYLVIAAVVVVFAVVGNWHNFVKFYLNWDVITKLLPTMITTGLKNTLLYTVSAFALGLVLGLILALMRLSQVGLYRWLATIYVEIFRGLPTLLVLFLITYGVPIIFGNVGFLKDFFIQATMGLGLVAAAYMSETIRAGIQAVPKGQMEAARSLGMSRGRAMISIIIPQAFRIVIPPMTNELILLVKDSSLVYILGVAIYQYELTKLGQNAASGGIIGIPSGPTPLLMAGVLYLVITLPLSQLVRALERRQAKRR
jgi:polar amino acid transport system permease protein